MNDSATSFDDLARTHTKRLVGFFRVRIYDDSLASDLIQQTWLEVARRIDTFDPAVGTFWSFTRVWAKIVLKRHWAESREIPAAEAPEEAEEDGPLESLVAEQTPPERALALSRALMEVLRRVMGCSRPPHEIIVFGFSKLEWKPSEIADGLGSLSLDDLGQRLEQRYAELVPAGGLHAAFTPLRGRLALPVAEAISDPRSRRSYPTLLERRAGATTLGDYFPPDRAPEEAITRWWDAVKRAVFHEIRELGDDAML